MSIVRKISHKDENGVIANYDVGALGSNVLMASGQSLENAMAAKIDKVSGKGLSTNDFTTAEKSKLAGIAAGAEVNVNADWNATSGDAQILNKPTAFPASGGNADTVGGKRASDFANSSVLPVGTDLNTVLQSGMYRMQNGHANSPNNLEYGQLLVIHGGSDTIAQVVFHFGAGSTVYHRSGYSIKSDGTGTWNPWKKINDGGDAATVGGFTVGCSVPSNAKFTDTIYILPIAGSSLGGVKNGGNVTINADGTMSAVTISFGSYMGNGGATRTISLSKTPQFVILYDGHGVQGYFSQGDYVVYGGLALNGSPCNASGGVAIEIITGGFKVGANGGNIATNISDVKYSYIWG